VVAARVNEHPAVGEPVTVNVAMRDRWTLEVRRLMPLTTGDTPAEHAVDVYFFFPRVFGVNARGYTRDEFFGDTTVHLRLAARHLTLLELSDLEHPQNPAALLRNALPRIVTSDAPRVESLVTLAQMFGAELADAIESEVRRLHTLIAARPRRRKRPKVKVGRRRRLLLEDGVTTLTENGLRALAALRRLRAKAMAYRAVAHPSLFSALAFAEEHTTSVFEEQVARLADAIDAHAGLRDGSGLAPRLRLRLAAAAQHVARRRMDQGFAVPWGASQEMFVYRSGVVKKELQRALYIDTRNVARDPLFANTAAMVAAGLAATWATLAQVPLLTGSLSTRQGSLLFVAAVAAYMVKDRIKEWTRQFLARRLLVWDHDRRIASTTLRHVGLVDLEGRARERLVYLENDKVPVDVKRARQSQRTVSGVTHELEDVIHYRRVVRLDPAKSSTTSGLGVRELIRYSLVELLDRLDESTEPVAYFDPQRGTFVARDLPKVYHLNVVVKTQRANGETTLARARVIVDHDGIKRIEPVLLPVAKVKAAEKQTPAASGRSTTGSVPLTG
jgi:hypothetical protein